MNVLHRLQQSLHAALSGLVPDPAPYAAMLKPAQGARFGDYQANCAMPLAKVLGKKPPEVAREIVQRLDLGDMLEAPEVAGPGFINLRLRSDWLASQLRAMARDERLGVEPVTAMRSVVIDYSSPNVAKPMHVGHLRSTIIGDALARLYRFLGHHVTTDNHLGDWGTQFGMLLYGYKHLRNEEAFNVDPVQELSRLYREVRKLIDPAEKVEDNPADAKKYSEAELARSREVLTAVRQETARLHEGDAENRRLWELFMPSCLAEIESVYRLLGTLPFDHTLGESFYNPMLPEVVRDLRKRGIAVESRGALVVPPRTWKPDPKDDDPPEIIRKSDGAFAYMTTDLATIKYRVETWGPDVVLYVVDFRQGNHFQHLFATARAWGYDRVALEHVSFGTVMTRDPETGKPRPMKTREGDLTELHHLLGEAVRRAAQVQAENTLVLGEGAVNLSEEERQEIHRVVGIGAVKYADLSQNRTSDYLFDWDKMLAMDGNTATYMQYAYARNRSIFRRGDIDVDALRAEPPPVLLGTPDERALAVQLLRFHEALEAAAADYRPSLITAYLWDLAKTYSGFFQNCPVLKAETPELRRSRLLLCDLTARVIQRGLDLLGIRTVERM